MDTNKLYWIGGGVTVLLLAGGAYWYYTKKADEKKAESSSLTIDLSKVAGDGSQIKVNLPQSMLNGTTGNTGIAGNIGNLVKNMQATAAAKS